MNCSLSLFLMFLVYNGLIGPKFPLSRRFQQFQLSRQTGSDRFCLDRFGSVRFASVRFGSVRITSDRFGSVLAGS